MTTAAPKRLLRLPGVLAFALALAGCTAGNDDGGASPSPTPAAESAESAEPIERQQAAGATARALQEGQCMTDNGTAAAPDIQVLDCAEPHAFEVFATTELPDGAYPGTGEADARAQEFCLGEFESFVGLDYDASALDLQYFYPVEAQWTGSGGRTVVCLVGDTGGGTSTGTLRNSTR